MVRKGEDQLFQEGFLYFEEGFLMVNRPLPHSVLVDEGEKGFGKVGKSRYDFPIEVAEFDEGSDCFYTIRGEPAFDSFKFGGVHFDRTREDEEAEVFDFGGVKGTFGEFQGEVLFVELLQDMTGALLMESEVIG